MPYFQPKGGWIEIICGSMFSGKTEELIRRVRRAEIARQRVQVFKPKLDDRYSASQVASHDGGHAEAEVIESAAEILEKLAPQTTVVAIDEAQFFDWGVADVARLLADRGHAGDHYRAGPGFPRGAVRPDAAADGRSGDGGQAACHLRGVRRAGVPHPASDQRPTGPLHRPGDPGGR